MEKKNLTNYGYANSWGGRIPDVIKQCKHPMHSETVGTCLHKFWCEFCGYEYYIDSSG